MDRILKKNVYRCIVQQQKKSVFTIWIHHIYEGTLHKKTINLLCGCDVMFLMFCQL